jgi:hypothetical protein
MTPEERLDRIEATLDRTLSMCEKMNIRHAGMRGMYRHGVNRFEEMLDRQEQLDALLAALMDSQLRTEHTVRQLAESVQKFIDAHNA